MSQGRGNLTLMEQSVTEIAQTEFLKIFPNTSVADTIQLLKKRQQTEAYCVEGNGTYVGKLFLPQLLKLRPNTKVHTSVMKSETVIPANASMFQAIEIASDFVGEALAVVDTDTNKIVGTVTEADLFQVYLKAQSDVHKLEHG